MHTPNSERISPTAHYVGWIKYRAGVGGPELVTRTGRLFHYAFWPLMTAFRLLGGIDYERSVVARHRSFDHLLTRAIEDGAISQVVELAAGLSPRGREFVTRHADRELIYVEGDLPGMCARKREALAVYGPLSRGHHIVELDALLDSGPMSLAGVCERLLDPARGTAIVCEGLTSYFDRATILRLWRAVARSLARHGHGYFLSEVYFPSEFEAVPLFRAVRGTFGAIIRGRMHLAFQDIADVEAELERAGFTGARVHRLGDLARELGFAGHPDQMPIHVFEATLESG